MLIQVDLEESLLRMYGNVVLWKILGPEKDDKILSLPEIELWSSSLQPVALMSCLGSNENK
jgi:hypothetical protein